MKAGDRHPPRDRVVDARDEAGAVDGRGDGVVALIRERLDGFGANCHVERLVRFRDDPFHLSVVWPQLFGGRQGAGPDVIPEDRVLDPEDGDAERSSGGPDRLGAPLGHGRRFDDTLAGLPELAAVGSCDEIH